MEITRLPSFDADSGVSLAEIKSYIIRLDRALSLMLDNVGEENLSPALAERLFVRNEQSLDSLKNEIIETATYIKEVGDKIELRLANEYVAKGELGQYTEQALHSITVDGKGVTQYFEEISRLEEQAGNMRSELDGNSTALESLGADVARLGAYIRTGKLSDGVYGIEIGRSDSNIKARFTNDRLSFYQGLSEVAYISGSNLYITRAEILDYFRIGNSTDGYFTFDVSENGLEVMWSGGN
jgi:tetrahydromethanopterin S-methyltransferase subunit B